MTSGLDIILRVVIAGLLGGVVGFDRQLRDKPAGMRTHMLVAIGAALFVGITVLFIEDAFDAAPGVPGDPLRVVVVIAAVATGIGFLGAGAIIQGVGGRVRGLTTAAGIWVVAAIGVAVGLGFYLIAIAATAATAAIIAFLGFVEPRRTTPEDDGGGD